MPRICTIKGYCSPSPWAHALSAEKRISVGSLKNRKVLFIRRGWNRYIDDLRDRLESEGVRTEDFEMFNISAYNRAVSENVPIITVEGWEDVHPLLRLIPADWEDTIPVRRLLFPDADKAREKIYRPPEQHCRPIKFAESRAFGRNARLFRSILYILLIDTINRTKILFLPDCGLFCGGKAISAGL